MAEELNVIFQELKSIRTYLIKIGPGRRSGNILEVKRTEANKVLIKYNDYITFCKYKISLKEINNTEITLINKICEEFSNLYEEILNLCCVKEEDPSSKLGDNMANEKFDLKIALSILPVMANDIESTKNLIEGIEYYSSILNETDCQKKLIQFVLKSRLSQQAKLQLSQQYSTIDELIKDMRRKLLPQKSHTALQSKLLHCKQNNRTLDDFGKEISELFADLTISQADGDSEKYKVLRPLNEKMAIKSFSDGLRNSRLSTVITARNYNSLTDAIQAAKDEEINAPSTSEGIMGMYKRSNFRAAQRRSQRGQYTRQRGFRSFNRSRGYQRPPYNQQNQVWSQQNNYRGTSFRNSNRGRNFGRNRGQPGRNNVNFMATKDNAPSEDSHLESLNHFFRE